MCSSSTSTHGSLRSKLVVDSTVHSLPFTRTPNRPGRALTASWATNDTWATRGRAKRRAGDSGVPRYPMGAHFNALPTVGAGGLATTGTQRLAPWQGSRPHTVGYALS